jgi:hypothetical protein
MALPAGSTLYIRIWTRQRCVGCGTLYQYLSRYAVPASSVAGEATVPDLEAYYARFERGRYCPCPRCSVVQPDMIAASHDADYFLIGIGGSLLLALLFVLNVTGGRGPVEALIAANAFALAVASVVLLRVTFKNHNRLPADKQRLMADELERGRVAVLEEGRGAIEVVLPTTAGQWAIAFLVLAGGVLVCLLPLVVPAVPVWTTQLTAVALFVWAVWTLSKSVAPRKDAGVAVATEVTSRLIEGDEVPKDFRDFVKGAGQYKFDRPGK